jgi:hypothetical protein
MGPSQERRANEEEMRQMNLAVSKGAIEVLYERLDINQVDNKYRKRVSTVVRNVKRQRLVFRSFNA